MTLQELKYLIIFLFLFANSFFVKDIQEVTGAWRELAQYERA